MRLLSLELRNVGPFDEASLELLDGPEDETPVALLTGLNGTGKTVILDAIRSLFGSAFAVVERDLRREKASSFSVIGDFADFGDRRWLRLEAHGTPKEKPHPTQVIEGGHSFPFLLDFWRSDLAHDDGAVKAFEAPEHEKAFHGALQGGYRNRDVNAQLVRFDYLRDSQDAEERRVGGALWELAGRIVERCLLHGGRLRHVLRATLTPMVESAGHLVPVRNLSSGNAYLIGRMLTLLGRAHSVAVLSGLDAARCNELSGLLLVDEAENHLHPSWQKRFLPIVREIFPNLQIVATTHSPFVLASIPGARVFVCRYDEARRTCTVADETADYASKPVDEILASPAFDETPPFGPEISDLLRRRAEAWDAGDAPRVADIEAELRRLNPTHFAYLDIEARLREVRRTGT